MSIMPKTVDQAEHRDAINFRDQHGREWHAAVEKVTLHPTGPILPLFRAPIFPPPSYLKAKERPHIGQLEINYDAWYQDLSRSSWDWDNRLAEYAAALHPQSIAAALEDPSPQLLKLVGPKPLDPRVPLACKAGNKWILGLPQPDGRPYPQPDKDWAHSAVHWAAGVTQGTRVPSMEEIEDEFADVLEEDEEERVDLASSYPDPTFPLHLNKTHGPGKWAADALHFDLIQKGEAAPISGSREDALKAAELVEA